jgi:hypothetical protein
MEVRCVHHTEGCEEWIVVGRDERNLHSHLLHCPYHPVQCEQCGQSMPRQLLSRHLFADCSDIHCSDVTWDAKLERRDECEEERARCDICGDEYRRKEQDAHMDRAMMKHVKLQQMTIKRQREEIVKLRKAVEETVGMGKENRRAGSVQMDMQGKKRRRSLCG